MLLTVEDLRLLRDVIAWARAEGWRPCSRGWITSRWGTPLEVAYTGPFRAPTGLTIKSGHEIICRANNLRSIRAAVDVLIAYSYLPATFSSAYWAGREDGIGEAVDHEIDGRLDTAYELVESGDLVEAAAEKHVPELLPGGFDRRAVVEQLGCVVRDVLGEAMDRR